MEGFDSKIADISLHQWGRKEIKLAEVEMPGIISLLTLIGLMACRTEFGPKNIFKGAKISGSLHMTI